MREFVSVEVASVAGKFSVGGGPDFPGDVGDVIFDGAAVRLARISPIVFGDELFEAAFNGQRWRPARVCFQLVLLVS